MVERWRTIEDFNDYEVSTFGRVRTKKTKRIKSQLSDYVHGYSRVILYKNKKRHYINTHRLVAKAFIPMILGKDIINHKDECKTNNNIDNLEWCDHQYNNNYGTRIQRMKETLKNKRGA